MSFRNNKKSQWSSNSNDNRNDRRNSSFRKNNNNYNSNYTNYKWTNQISSSNNNKNQNFGSNSHRNNTDYSFNWQSRNVYGGDNRRDGFGMDIDRYSPSFNNQQNSLWNREPNYPTLMSRNNINWSDCYSSNYDEQQITNNNQMDVPENLFPRRLSPKPFTRNYVHSTPCPSTVVSNSNDKNVVSPDKIETVKSLESDTEPLQSTSKRIDVSNLSTNEPMKSISAIKSPTSLSCSAEQVTKKLIHQLTSMDKHNLKQMINNPNSKFDTVLQSQARKKIREEMRKQLRNMSSDTDNQLLQNMLDPEECIDSDKIPETVFDEIERVLDINLLGNDFSSNFDNSCENDNSNDNKEDLYLRAERLLMENTFILEDRLNSNINSRSNSPIDEPNETKTETCNSINFINISPLDCLDNSKRFDDHFIDILDDTNGNNCNVSLPKLQNLTFLSANHEINECSPSQDNKTKETTFQNTEDNSKNSENCTTFNALPSSKNNDALEKSTKTKSCKPVNKYQDILQNTADKPPQKTDLITKLRNLDAMKSSAAEKKLKKKSIEIQLVKSSKSSKKRKRTKEKRKEKSKLHREKYLSSSLSIRKRRKSSTSKNSRSSSSSSSISNDSTNRGQESISLKNSKQIKKQVKSKSFDKLKTHTPEPKIESIQTSKDLKHTPTSIIENNDLSITSVVNINDPDYSNDKFRATLEALKKEGDDEECKSIIQNIELLIEKEYPRNKEITENNSEKRIENIESVCDQAKEIMISPNISIQDIDIVQETAGELKNTKTKSSDSIQQPLIDELTSQVVAPAVDNVITENSTLIELENLNELPQLDKTKINENNLTDIIKAPSNVNIDDIQTTHNVKLMETVEGTVLDEPKLQTTNSSKSIDLKNQTKINKIVETKEKAKNFETTKIISDTTILNANEITKTCNNLTSLVNEKDVNPSDNSGSIDEATVDNINHKNVAQSENEIIIEPKNQFKDQKNTNESKITFLTKDSSNFSINNENSIVTTSEVFNTESNINDTIESIPIYTFENNCDSKNDSKLNLSEQDEQTSSNSITTDDITKKFKIFNKDPTDISSPIELNSINSNLEVTDDTVKKDERNENKTIASKTKTDNRREHLKSSSSTHRKIRHKHSHNDHSKKKDSDSKSKDRSKDLKESTKTKDLIHEIPSSTSSNDGQPKYGSLDLQPQTRLWRSPGEKKCIEPLTPPPYTGTHKFEEAISSTMFNSELKRSKHSSSKNSKHKTREKSSNEKKNTKVTTDTLNIFQSEKTDPTELLKNTVAMSQSLNDTLATNANFPFDLFGLIPASSSLHGMSLTEPMRLVTESHQYGSSESVFNRMKDIDVKLLELQHNKMQIEEKILQLQKEKISIDQNTMQLQNERFLLLGSLLASKPDNNLINPTLLPLTINTTPEKESQTQKDVAKISVVSPNSINKSHQNSIKSTDHVKNNDKNTTTNSMKRVLGIVDITKDLSAYIKNKRKHSASQKTKPINETKTTTAFSDSIIVDDHNYAETIDDLDKDHQAKRKKTDNFSIDGKNQKLSVSVESSMKSKNLEKFSKNSVDIQNNDVLLSKSLKKKSLNKHQSTDKSNAPEKVQTLSICLTPIQKLLPSYVQEISDTESKSNNVPDSLINKKDLKGQRLNKRKIKTGKRLNQNDFSIDKNNASMELYLKKCYVKLTRIKSSDYLLNFRGFEMNDNVLVPHSSDISDIERYDDLKRESKTEPFDRNVFDGQLFGHKTPITCVKIVGKYILAASEDGGIYKYDLNTGKLLDSIINHDKTITWIVSISDNFIYSVALDGFLKQFSVKDNLSETLSYDFKEPLQAMDYEWDTLFIGSKNGKIFIHNVETNLLSETVLCTLGKSIMALKTAKEGPRKILIVSLRSSNINVRDAISGLLLRSIQVPLKITVYSILLDGGNIHCGTNQNIILTYDFANGTEIFRQSTGSSGTICLKMYNNSIILGASYDGFIYAFDKRNKQNLNRIQGPGKPLLHFDVSDNQIVASSKDKSLTVWKIPDEIKNYMPDGTIAS